jgi:hypothetical protein
MYHDGLQPIWEAAKPGFRQPQNAILIACGWMQARSATPGRLRGAAGGQHQYDCEFP